MVTKWHEVSLKPQTNLWIHKGMIFYMNVKLVYVDLPYVILFSITNL